MLFSDAFSINQMEDDDWFDLLLNQDTKLFIDPFLLYDDEKGDFIGSHADVMEFFNHVLGLIAKNDGHINSPNWKRATNLLRFPEVEEICLGYTSLGTRGSGAGKKTATQMARGLLRAVQAGLVQLTHFEEVQIFEEGIGADTISDATATIIRPRLAAYTNRVCERHDIPIQQVKYDRGTFSAEKGRWLNKTFTLPHNPINGKPVLLVPKRYLRRLPTINPDGFWDYCFDNHNEILRQKYGDDISRNVDKSTIVELARAQPNFRADYLRESERKKSNSYNLEKDPNGLYQPAAQAFRWAKQHPKKVQPTNDAELTKAVVTFIEEFRNFVENQRGWRLLWNDGGTPKAESSFQALFMQTVATHCRANDIEVSPEANIGRGPVDFKMAIGYSARVLVEAKLARNSRFWHGLEKQLPKYLEAENVSQGIFVVCVYTDEEVTKINDINKRVAKLNETVPYRVRAIIVNAQESPPSASLLT